MAARPTLTPDGSRTAPENARPARRAVVPRPPDLELDGTRRAVVRADDRPTASIASGARPGRPVLDADPRSRGERARRDRQGPVPDRRRAGRRGGPDALPGRQAVAVPLFAIRLSADLHLLCD